MPSSSLPSSPSPSLSASPWQRNHSATADPVLYHLHAAALLALPADSNTSQPSPYPNPQPLPALSASQHRNFLRQVLTRDSPQQDHSPDQLHVISSQDQRRRYPFWLTTPQRQQQQQQASTSGNPTVAAASSSSAPDASSLVDALSQLPEHWKIHNPLCSDCGSKLIPGITATFVGSSSSSSRQRREQGASSKQWRCLCCRRLGQRRVRPASSLRARKVDDGLEFQRKQDSKAQFPMVRKRKDRATIAQAKSSDSSKKDEKRPRVASQAVEKEAEAEAEQARQPQQQPKSIKSQAQAQAQAQAHAQSQAQSQPQFQSQLQSRSPSQAQTPSSQSNVPQSISQTKPYATTRDDPVLASGVHSGAEHRAESRPDNPSTMQSVTTTTKKNNKKPTSRAQFVQPTSQQGVKSTDQPASGPASHSSSTRKPDHKAALRALLSKDKGKQGDSKGAPGVAKPSSSGTGTSGGGGLKDFLAGL